MLSIWFSTKSSVNPRHIHSDHGCSWTKEYRSTIQYNISSLVELSAGFFMIFFFMIYWLNGECCVNVSCFCVSCFLSVCRWDRDQPCTDGRWVLCCGSPLAETWAGWCVRSPGRHDDIHSLNERLSTVNVCLIVCQSWLNHDSHVRNIITEEPRLHNDHLQILWSSVEMCFFDQF